jgi:hypothetical protein
LDPSRARGTLSRWAMRPAAASPAIRVALVGWTMNLSAVDRTYKCRPPSLLKGAGAFQVVGRGRSNFRERGGSTSSGALPSGAASQIAWRGGWTRRSCRTADREAAGASRSRDCFLEQYAFPYLISSQAVADDLSAVEPPQREIQNACIAHPQRQWHEAPRCQAIKPGECGYRSRYGEELRDDIDQAEQGTVCPEKHP